MSAEVGLDPGNPVMLGEFRRQRAALNQKYCGAGVEKTAADAESDALTTTRDDGYLADEFGHVQPQTGLAPLTSMVSPQT